MTAESAHVQMARAVLDATNAAEQALRAIDTALALGGELGVAVFGFGQLMGCRQPLAALVTEHGPAVALSRNEIQAAQGETP